MSFGQKRLTIKLPALTFKEMKYVCKNNMDRFTGIQVYIVFCPIWEILLIKGDMDGYKQNER